MAAPFPGKAPGEKKLLTFNFSTELPVGVTLATPTVVAVTTVGNDPAAVSMVITNILVNTGIITLQDGTTIPVGQGVQCLADGGLEGCAYEFHAIGAASNGERVEIVAAMKVFLQAAKGK